MEKANKKIEEAILIITKVFNEENETDYTKEDIEIEDLKSWISSWVWDQLEML